MKVQESPVLVRLKISQLLPDILLRVVSSKKSAQQQNPEKAKFSNSTLFVDRQFLISISKNGIKSQTLDELTQLVSSPLFPKAQEEALKSPKSLLNLLGFLQSRFPKLFLIFKREPILLKSVLYGNALRSYEDENENDSLDANLKTLFDEKDQLAIESVY